MKIRGLFIILFTLFIIFSQGCEEDARPKGSLSVFITDDPFPIELISSAGIKIKGIDIRKSDIENSDSFIRIFDDTVTIDLIELQNGVTDKLVELEIGTGTYDNLRIYIESAILKLVDGQTFDIKVPGGEQTGIKVCISPGLIIEEELSEELVIDFNLGKSFVPQGNYYTPAGLKGFILKPVIRAVNTSDAGSIRGTVKDSDSNAIPGVQLTAKMDTISSVTFSDSTGFFSMVALPTGIYNLEAEKEGYEKYIDEVVVIAGNATSRKIVLTKSR